MNSSQPSPICKPTAQIIPFPRVWAVPARRKAVHELHYSDDLSTFLDSIPDPDSRRGALLGCYKLIQAAKGLQPAR